MNIYQKLKKAGYMTDGLTSPLKIDPPKSKKKMDDRITEANKEVLNESMQEAVSSSKGELTARREKSDVMDVVRSGLAGNVAPKKAPRAYYDGSKTYPNTHGLYSGPTRPHSSKKAATMTYTEKKLPKKAATMTHEKRKL
jgi:hypothetical protein